MKTHGINTRKLWQQIKVIINKTVLAMVPEIILNYEHYFYGIVSPQCFQVIKCFNKLNHFFF